MSSDRLREAARVLRERAEAATPGPWIYAYGHCTTESTECTGGGCGLGYGHEPGCGLNTPHVEAADADVRFIATMHPGVALALADWLDHQSGYRRGEHVWSTDHALRVADQILGRES